MVAACRPEIREAKQCEAGDKYRRDRDFDQFFVRILGHDSRRIRK